MRRLPAVRSLVVGSAALLSACGSDNGPNSDGRVEFNVATRAAMAANPSRASFDVTSPTPGTFTDGTNTLTLTSVQIVLREIELDRAGVDPLCDEAQVDDDACEELEVGPLLVDLPLGAGPEQTIVADVAAGTYDEIEFELHKSDNGSPADAAFLAANPGFEGVSVRVEGTFNGQGFTYTSDVNVEQEHELAPPLTIAESGATDLTMFVDVSRWFQTESGTLIDPATANNGQPNESLVEESIKNSVEAFEDEDEDGLAD